MKIIPGGKQSSPTNAVFLNNLAGLVFYDLNPLPPLELAFPSICQE